MPSPLKLQDGAKAAVVGGGPAGSFFSFFLLQTAERIGLDVGVDVYEPRDFNRPGGGSCNMCAGIISESLVQNLASEGLILPVEVLQRRIDGYFLHMDVGSVGIDTPLREKRIAAVHRGCGPRTFRPLNDTSFDAHLLGLAQKKGAVVVRERVREIGWNHDRPEVRCQGGRAQRYDVIAVATGVNGSGPKIVGVPAFEYAPPQKTKAFISEFHLGQNIVRQCFGSSIHIFLLDLPRIKFAAIIPKSDYVTACLLGRDIDAATAKAFLDSEEVRQCMPQLWEAPRRYCHCAPRLNVGAAPRSYADRMVFIGDSGVTRLFKDGIGSAYLTGKSAATTAVIEGVSADDFRRHYGKTCKSIADDNRIGRLIFAATDQIQKRRHLRRAVLRMVREEQGRDGVRRRMSTVLWDVFTGSAPYRSVLERAARPAFVGRLFWNALATLRAPRSRKKRPRSKWMVVSTEGVLGKKFKDGEVIYRQGEPGECMYLIEEGEVQVLRREGGREFCLAELGEGDFFGEIAVFEKEERNSTVRAVGDVLVHTLERDSLLRAVNQNPTLAYRLVQQMAYRIRELEASLVRRATLALENEAGPLV